MRSRARRFFIAQKGENMTEPIDYRTMYECAAEFARSLIQEANSKDEEIRRLEAEIRELKEQAEELRFNPNHDPKNGRFTSGNGVDISGGSGIIKLKDDFIGHSLSAKAKNYEVFDPLSAETFHFMEGTKIQNREVFAGYGTKISLHEGLTTQFGGSPQKWQHVKGNGILDYFGEERKAEIHWFQEETVGQVKHKVKRWLE